MKLSVLALIALFVAACATTKPTPQHFVPLSEQLQKWGTADYSDRELRFEAFKGTMDLKYVGRMPEAAGDELDGAAVYEVKNAKAFFEANRDVQGFCAEPARWVAVNSKNGAPGWSGEIWISLLTVDDWAKYTPEVQGHCAGGPYVRSQ